MRKARGLFSLVVGVALLPSIEAVGAERDRGDERGRRCCHATAAGFSITDLGTPGGTVAFASFINRRGQIAGSGTNAAGEQRAFIWEDGAMIDLGALGGAGNASFSGGFNDRGQVVGFSGPIGQNGHAFLWDGASMLDLGTLGGSFSSATDLNNRAQVVGGSNVATSEQHAFIWEDGTLTDLGTLGGPECASERLEHGHGHFIGGKSSACSVISFSGMSWSNFRLMRKRPTFPRR